MSVADNCNESCTADHNMRPAQAALYTGISESTLAKLRMRHNRDKGPRHYKVLGCVIYRRSDLDEWMNNFVVEGAAAG